MELFQGNISHKPLHGDEIRLLTLLPGNFNELLKCRIEHVSLASPPAYYALSYTWGDPSCTSLISLNGVDYPITLNLEAALRHLRLKDDVVTIWADAICVNQLDISERNIQVTRMRDIYEQAECTIVWLGGYAPQTKEDVDGAFDIVNRVYALLVADTYTEDAVQAIVKHRDVDVRSLVDICYRPWFSRVWVIQEVAMCKTPRDYITGSDNPLIMCGHSTMRFSPFCIAASAIRLASAITTPQHHPLHPHKGHGPTWVHQMRQIRCNLAAGEISLTRAEQLVTFLSSSAFAFEATDDRDKIYAILGLLSSHTLPASLQPDYGLSKGKIFWDFTIYILEETKQLDILGFCATSQPDIPSWVPDWKDGYPKSPFDIKKVSYLRFLNGNKTIEVDCMLVSFVDRILQPVEINIEFDAHTIIEYEGDEPTEASRRQVEKLMGFLAQVYKTLMAVEARWFGCRALDANLTPAELDCWIAALQIGFSTERTIDENEPQWLGKSARQLYMQIIDLPQLKFDGEIEESISALGSYCLMIKVGLRSALFQDIQGNYGRVRTSKTTITVGDCICYLKGGMHKFLIREEEAEGWRFLGTAWGMLPVSREAINSGSTEELKTFWKSHQRKVKRILIH